MDKNEKTDIFIDQSNLASLDGRMLVFHDKLKRHLSNEYLFFSEKKDNLENEILQLKMEQEQKDKTLFPSIEKKDVRKYFSPLNLTDMEEEKKDEKEKQLLASIHRINGEVELLQSRMVEIKNFLRDIEKIQEYEKENIEILEEKEGISKNKDWKSEEKNSSHFGLDPLPEDFFKPDDRDCNLSGYLSQLALYHQQQNNLEILVELNEEDVNLDFVLIQKMISQIHSSIISSLKIYDISTLLIEGSVEKNDIEIVMDYACDNAGFDAFQVTYHWNILS